MPEFLHGTKRRAAAGQRLARACCLRSAGLWALLLVVAVPATGSDSSGEEVRMALMDGVFGGLNRTDALASIKAWIEGVAESRGFHKRGVTTIYEDLGALRDAVQAGRVHITALQSDDWLQLAGTCDLTPVFIPTLGESMYDQILLVVRKDAGVSDLAQLRGTTVVAHNTAGKRLGELWLDHELRTRGLPAQASFFRSIEAVDKPSGAVLSVFFGKHPACLVARKSFDTAAELNPQLAQQLAPLLVSPEIVGSVLCVWSEDWPHKQDLLDALAELHETAPGRQILAVFRTGRLVPYEAAAFGGVETIMNMNASAAAPGRVRPAAAGAAHRQVFLGAN